MKLRSILLILFCIGGVCAFTYCRVSKKSAPFYPVVEEKSFIIIIPSYNNALHVEKNLRSVFSQHYHNYKVIYIDDGSNDATLSRVDTLLEQLDAKSKTTLVSHPTHEGTLASLYTEIHKCKDQDIIIWLRGDDFFAHEQVLTHLNQVYASPQVWLTLGGGLTYPDYRLPWEETLPVSRKKTHSLPPLPTFYASLFKEIELKSLFFRGHFFQEAIDQVVLFPLLEMAKDHAELLKQPLCLRIESEPFHPHQSILCAEAVQRAPQYAPLKELPRHIPSSKKADLVIFSKDNPLQLATLLTSIDRHMVGLNKITVLYQASDSDYEQGYQKLKWESPNTLFVDQKEKKFAPLCKKLLFQNPLESPYILLAKDNLVLTEQINLSEGIDLVEQTGAYGLFYAHHLELSYSADLSRYQPLPLSTSLQTTHAWQFKEGRDDWNSPASLRLSLYRKKDLKAALWQSEMENPNEMISNWHQNSPADAVGLFYPSAKCIELKLSTKNCTKSLLLERFKAGWEIDPGHFANLQLPSHQLQADLEMVGHLKK